MSVVSVRKSPPRDENGVVDPKAIPDTVAVSGTFHDPLGFFSLTEYLSYAEKQLKLSYHWADQTNVREALEFAFPWKKIDSSQVRAIGFESKQFAFELDKPKILKLLTGHTLYSDSNVVVRELVQNSLDATRLQTHISGSSGEIALHLDSAKRLLTVDDNGTGMTQRIIEDHFLNVGSSRYQDESFRKQYPRFSAISRFGIGILSTFMISDEIEVVTKSALDSKARNISIRSINGRYLIRLLDPSHADVPSMAREHGTRLQLKLRAGVPLPDLRLGQFYPFIDQGSF
jgi:molecular chaperone HtpG